MSTTATINESTCQEERFKEHLLAQGRTFCWHQIFAPSSAKSIEFYTKAFGWGTEEMPMGDGGIYRMLTVNGIPVAGAIGTDEGCADVKNVPPHWSISVAVDNIEAKVTECEQLGASVLVPINEIPGVGRAALIQDPQGAAIWLFQGNC